MKQTAVYRAACGALLAILFLLSISSLYTFPSPYDDEGLYAAYGYGYVTTGKFASPSIVMREAFKEGNAWNPRMQAALFGLTGFVSGHSLETGRAVSFVLVALSVALWFFIAQALGFSGWLGALAFAATERVFYSSHVLRPESAAVLFNSVLVWWIFCREKTDAKNAFGRGLLNAPLVLAHGNGVVAALINAIEWLGKIWKKKSKAQLVVFFGVGSLLSIVIFYAIHFHSVGGLSVAQEQIRANTFTQYNVKPNFFDSIASDLKLRWGLELVEVGGSVVAKAFRWFFYLSVLFTSLFTIRRKSSLMALGVFVGFMVLVPDKIDIHISEMMPFFWASLLIWCKNAKSPKASLLIGALIASQFALCMHHALKYRGETSRDRVATVVENFLKSKDGNEFAKTGPITITGAMHFWFNFRERYRFIGQRYIDEVPNLRGNVLAITAAADATVLKKCQTVSKDAEGIFVAMRCN